MTLEQYIELFEKPNFKVEVDTAELLSLFKELRDSRELIKNQAQYEESEREHKAACDECAADHRQLSEWLMELKDLRAEQNDQYVFIRELMSELKEAKRLLKLTVDTNYSLHKYCYNCSHSTSDHHCDIDKYLYGTGEKECEWEWKHMNEAMKLVYD